MIWYPRSILVPCLVALALGQVVIGQDVSEAADSEASLSSADELKDASANATPAPSAAETAKKIENAGEILSQALFSRFHAPLGLFQSMFPGLAQLIFWGGFGPNMLGAPLEQTPAASKVILVLAEDRDPAASQPTTRITRQNSDMIAQMNQAWQNIAQPADGSVIVGQSLLPGGQAFPQFLPSDASQMVGQAWERLQELSNGQTPDQVLQQAHQGAGALLAQLPPLDFSQFRDMQFNMFQLPPFGQILSPGSLLGAPMPGAADPAASPESPESPETPAMPESPVAPASAPAAQPSPMELLGQVRRLFDTKQPSFWPQPLQPMNDNQADASEISEVRLKPEFAPQAADTDKVSEMKAKAAIQEALTMKSVPVLWFQLPAHGSTNYRTTDGRTTKSPEDIQMEKQLQAFERQVIMELMQLQEIERQAKQYRAAAEQSGAKQPTKQSPFKLSYPLSKTPLHKITRGDIEKALQDEYVRKALLKAAHPKGKFTANIYGMPMKRQTSDNAGTATTRHLQKEDIIKLMAYAYRMASANGQELPWQAGAAKDAKGGKLYAAYRSNDDKTTDPRQWTNAGEGERKMELKHEQTPEHRQWVNEQRQFADMNMKKDMFEEQHWADNDRRTQQMADQRQWVENKSMPPTPAQAPTPNQRQWPVEQHPRQNIQPQNMPDQFMDQRQWADQKTQHQMFEHQEMMKQMPDQRQWADQKTQQQETSEQRQMQQKMFEHQEMMKQMPDQRQWADQKTQQQETPEQRQMQQQMFEHQEMMKQMPDQRQWADQKTQQPMPDQRQWADQKTQQQETPEQRQMQQQMFEHQEMMKQMPDQRQWADQKTQQQETPEQRQIQQQTMFDRPEMMQQMPENRQWTEDKAKTHMPQLMRNMEDPHSFRNPNNPMMLPQQPMQLQLQEQQQQQPQLLLGEATPQMPENAGKARHKDLFDDFDLFGGKSKGGKGKRPQPQTIINYYYGQGGSRYPVYGGYSAGRGHAASYGGSAGYGGGYGAGATAGYGGQYGRPAGSPYGGGAYGSNAYGGGGGGGGMYRTATGNDEIDSMLMQHQVMPATLFRK